MRLARDPSGTVVVDARGVRPGRGAYVCADAGCVERILKPGRLAHAFRGAGAVDPGLDMAVQQARRR